MDQDLYICEYFPQYSGLQNKFMKNQGNETFVNVNNSVFPFDFSNSYTSGTADWNHDGYPDLVVSNYSPQNTNFWLSGGGTKHSISIALEGVVSNKEGIGAWMHVYAGNEHQVRYSMCGENYMGQDSQYELFGLNDFTTVDSIRVEWPSGHVDHLYNVEADQRLWIIEGSGMVTSILPSNNGVLCSGDSLTLDAGDYSSFLWDDGTTSRYRIIQEPGSYNVLVTSSLGFSSNAQITIDSVFDPLLSFEIHAPLCFGESNGSIIWSAGIQPDSFQWSIDSTGTSITNLSAGAYSLITSYDNGCSFSNHWELNEPDSLFVNFEVSHVACAGDSTGSVSIAETNAINYSLVWENSELNTSELSAGTYVYQLTDEENCSIVDSIVVNEPEPLNFIANITHVQCFGNNDGQIELDLYGGSPPYSIDWNGLDPMNLAADTYEVIGSDDHGCTLPMSFEVLEPSALIVSTEINCVDESLNVNTTVEGGSPPYEYSWSNGYDDPNLSGIPEDAILSLLVTDSLGCEYFIENIMCPLGIYSPDPNPSFLYPNPFTNFVYLDSRLHSVHSFRIYDSRGKLISLFLTNSAETSFNLDSLSSGVYFVELFSDQHLLIGIQKLYKL